MVTFRLRSHWPKVCPPLGDRGRDHTEQRGPWVKGARDGKELVSISYELLSNKPLQHLMTKHRTMYFHSRQTLWAGLNCSGSLPWLGSLCLEVDWRLAKKMNEMGPCVIHQTAGHTASPTSYEWQKDLQCHSGFLKIAVKIHHQWPGSHLSAFELTILTSWNATHKHLPMSLPRLPVWIQMSSSKLNLFWAFSIKL